jgi:hypothetical protein
VVVALRATDLGARPAQLTSGPFAGMAAIDGPVPVRTHAHTGRLMCVDDLAHIPLSDPTYAGILVSVAVKAAHERSAGKHTRRNKQFGESCFASCEQ